MKTKMRMKMKGFLINMTIILAPVAFIMYLLTTGITDTATLGIWDLAISIGAIVSVLLFMMRNKK